MKFLIFRKIADIYRRWKDNNEKLVILGVFLTDILENSILNYKNKSACDCEEKLDTLACRCNEIRGNLAYINFIRDNKVIVGIQFCEDNPQEIVVDRDNLKDIVKKWQILKEANVDEIVITMINNKILIIGRSFTPEEKLKHEQTLKAWNDTPLDLKHDKEYFAEFQKKWRSFTLEELKQLEREFYIVAMSDELAEWDTNEQ